MIYSKSRKKMKNLLIFIIFFVTQNCRGQNANAIIYQDSLKAKSSQFDKKEWLVSSEYRYTISKSDKFPSFKGKSKKYVKRMLGKPDEEDSERFIYCLGLNALKQYDTKLKRYTCDCNGAFVIIDFVIDERWRTTFSWPE